MHNNNITQNYIVYNKVANDRQFNVKKPCVTEVRVIELNS